MRAIPKEVSYKVEPPLVLIDEGLGKGRPVTMPIDGHSEPVADLEAQGSSPLFPYPLPDPLPLHRGLVFGCGLYIHLKYRKEEESVVILGRNVDWKFGKLVGRLGCPCR